MKKNKIKIFNLLILFSLFLLCPINTFATSNISDYKQIKEDLNINVDDLKISDIKFKNWSNETSRNFGLNGFIYNESNEDIIYKSTVYYYDKNYNILGSTTNISYIESEKKLSYNIMADLNVLNSNYHVDDIYYYKLIIETDVNMPTDLLKKPSEQDIYNSLDYVIDKYKIDINVNEDNSLDITENIKAYFNVEKHGIYRTIPLKNIIARNDGTTETNNAKIKNLSVNAKYSTLIYDGNYKIKIGDSDKLLLGEQNYQIKYKYYLGKDKNKDFDELYYNIIGTDWDTAIGNVSFKINLPKNFDSSKLGFSKGTKGSTDTTNIIYQTENNIIIGYLNGTLNKYEGLTIRLALDEGYFKNITTLSNVDYFLIFIPILFVIISIILWIKYGIDKKVIETVEFYPPDDFDSLEIGFIYKGYANDKDVVSLLIYLANKGYIKIVENDEKTLFTNVKGFKLIKLKDYDGDNLFEREFLENLFKSNYFSNEAEKKEVTSMELRNRFYSTINSILSKINSKDNKNKIIEESSSKKKKYLIIMMIITYLLITVIPVLNYQPGTLPFAIIFPLIGFLVITFTCLKNTNISAKIFSLVWGLGFGGIPWLIMVLPALLDEKVYLLTYLVGIISIIIILFIMNKLLLKRTDYGSELLGKIKGFKSFLETVEKEKLESMVLENPTYFYDILPYTYVLGISDKWIKKFETISNINSPDWYNGTSNFNITTFNTFITSTMKTAQSSMTSSPSSSSGGSHSSSGGGSSGGGSGGGGGSSW